MSENAEVLQRIIVSVVANSGKQKSELYHALAETQRMIEALKRENAELIDELRRERQKTEEMTSQIRMMLTRVYH